MSDKSHPYVGQPDYQFWKAAPGADEPDLLDPVIAPRFPISATDKVVTVGSCFAQHLARHLKAAAFNHFVTEPGHPAFPPALLQAFNYGIFSARYGNVYTARQLLQLLQRAYGMFEPVESHWVRDDGATVDPFRPRIQAAGFLCAEELAADRHQHFAAVRQAIEEMNVLVFTLGLTEAWRDRRDGAVYPLAPGLAGGRFDDTVHAFHNFGVGEVAKDIMDALLLIRQKNPSVRVLLTVSPVPLNATAVKRHVLVSTTYSKSVLRVAADIIAQRFRWVDYFPSYEIITAPHVRGRYFGEDARTVLEPGVEHVMRLFFKHYGGIERGERRAKSLRSPEKDEHIAEMEAIVQALCDEDAITNRAR